MNNSSQFDTYYLIMKKTDYMIQISGFRRGIYTDRKSLRADYKYKIKSSLKEAYKLCYSYKLPILPDYDFFSKYLKTPCVTQFSYKTNLMKIYQ